MSSPLFSEIVPQKLHQITLHNIGLIKAGHFSTLKLQMLWLSQAKAQITPYPLQDLLVILSNWTYNFDFLCALNGLGTWNYN